VLCVISGLSPQTELALEPLNTSDRIRALESVCVAVGGVTGHHLEQRRVPVKLFLILRMVCGPFSC